MGSKEKLDGEKTRDKNKDLLLEFIQRVDEINSAFQTSGTSAETSPDVQNIYKEMKQILKTTTKPLQVPSQASPHIRDELDKVFAVEEVGHSCDLCQRDLARDPERPNVSLRSLQEACVLSCGHVYHFKCLKGTTLDLDNHSKDPSCIFCIS